MSQLTDKFAEMERLRARVAQLCTEIARDVEAILAGGVAPPRAQKRAQYVNGTSPTPKSGKQRKTRAVVTPEMRARVKAKKRIGKMTAEEIALDEGISIPTVYDICKKK